MSLEAVLAQDRKLVLAGLIGLTLLSWGYLFYDVRTMDCVAMGMAAAMPQLRGWHLTDLVLTFVMWSIMMVAMMAPSVAPIVLVYSTLNRRRREQARPFVPTVVFLAGYLAVWTAFSGLATMVQWVLHATALLSPAMVLTNPLAKSGFLVIAGLFQWTPLKRACLTHCRSPLSFLMTEWREGMRGAFIMGWRHGRYCLGCCWFLMGLLFVAGVMNLAWVAILSVLVLAEKSLPYGRQMGCLAGIVLVGWGVWIATGSWWHL